MTTATTSPDPQRVLELFQKITAGEQAWEQRPAPRFSRVGAFTP